MIINTIILPEETPEEIAFDKVIELFNEESKKQKSKYILEMQYNYPILVKHWFWSIGNSLGHHQIHWNSFDNTFRFCQGIDAYTFNEIKPILDKINVNFEIELLFGEEKTEGDKEQ